VRVCVFANLYVCVCEWVCLCAYLVLDGELDLLDGCSDRLGDRTRDACESKSVCACVYMCVWRKVGSVEG
jgi:hypothetical protein